MSYISSLNILSEESSIPLSEQDVTDELSIWANAQFKFDSVPGSALLDDSLCKPDQELFKVFHSYNDFEQQQQQHTLMMNSNESNHKIETYSPLSIITNSDKSMMVTTHSSSSSSSPSYSGLSSPTTPDLYLQSNHPMNEMIFNKNNSNDDDDNNNTTTIQSFSTSSLSSSSIKEDYSKLSLKKKELTPDEDKRRRNTAASARFRLKKKLKEQALQQTVKEMSLKSEMLEKRCKELELEAKWLRALLVEKNPSLVTPLSKMTHSS
ncbi:unnamed protein product [Cunninghamella blakesleeana]